MPTSSNWTLPVRFPTKTLYVFIISPTRTIRHAHLILHIIILIIIPTFEVPGAVTMKIKVFWDLAPCSIVDVHEYTRVHGATSQNTTVLYDNNI
jgi:hypothetical protein